MEYQETYDAGTFVVEATDMTITTTVKFERQYWDIQCYIRTIVEVDGETILRATSLSESMIYNDPVVLLWMVQSALFRHARKFRSFCRGSVYG